MLLNPERRYLGGSFHEASISTLVRRGSLFYGCHFKLSVFEAILLAKFCRPKIVAAEWLNVISYTRQYETKY